MESTIKAQKILPKATDFGSETSLQQGDLCTSCNSGLILRSVPGNSSLSLSLLSLSLLPGSENHTSRFRPFRTERQRSPSEQTPLSQTLPGPAFPRPPIAPSLHPIAGGRGEFPTGRRAHLEAGQEDRCGGWGAGSSTAFKLGVPDRSPPRDLDVSTSGSVFNLYVYRMHLKATFGQVFSAGCWRRRSAPL